MRRLLFLFVAVFAATASLAFGISKVHAVSLQSTTTAFSLSDANGPIAAGSSISPSDLVTLTATVTNTGGASAPTGTLKFLNNSAPMTVGGTSSWTVTPVAGTNTSTVSVQTMLGVGSYAFGASFNGASNGYFPSRSDSPSPLTPFALTVTTAPPVGTTTTLATNAPAITTGDTATLTATVTAADGSIPQGSVTFYSNSGGNATPMGTASVDPVTGQAVYQSSTWAVQTYFLSASFTPTPGTLYSSSTSATVALDVLAKVNIQVSTTATATVTPSEIRSDQTVQLKATITQQGTSTFGSLVPGTVTFTSVTVTGEAVIGTANLTLNADGTASATYIAASLVPGAYTISAQYFGNLYFEGSKAAPISFVVHQAIPTTTTYIHDTQDYVGDTATLQARVLDPNGNPVPAGELVPLSANDHAGTQCIGMTDSSGYVTCTAVFPVAGTYTVTASYPGDSTYEPSTGFGTIVISQIPTTATVTATPNPVPTGATDTLTGQLLDARTSPGTPIAGKILTLSLNNNETCTTGPTDANGRASCTVRVSESPGTWPTTVSFGGDARYLPSSGNGTLQVVAIQPTNWTYNGASTALAGQPTSISFTLRDGNGQVMPFRNVTLDLNGTDYPVTTDANGVATQAVTAPATAGSYTPTADYGGETGYTGSHGTGTLVVTTIPTNLTYTGTTGPIYGGTPATISFVLTDSGGHVLAGQTVTETLPGGGTYTHATDANGVISTTITAPTPSVNTSYTPHATFAGNLPYLSSAGDGSLQVTVVPTNITYQGATSALAGAQAAITFVLKDSTTGNTLPYMPVTLTLPDGSTYMTTTDANGVASKTVTAPIHPGSYPVSESFGGQAQYLPSTGTGKLVVTTIPTAITYVGDTTVVQGATATLAARLTDNSGIVLPNETLTLTMSTGETCSGVTNASGVASCQVVVNEATTLPGSPYPITITFNGDLPYLPSTGTGAIAVTGPAAVPPAPGWCSSAGHKCESILANPTVVSPTQLKILYADDSALPTTAALAPTAVLDGSLQLYTTFAATSGVTPNYVDSYGGSVATKNEDWLNIKLPTCLTPGQHTVRIFANDGDGDWDQYTWTIQANGDCSVYTVNPGPGTVTCGGSVKCESILADPAVVSSSQLSIVAMDDSAIPLTGATAPSATLNGQALQVSAVATSGQAQNYVDKNGGSVSTKSQALITITLPALTPGSYSILVTAYDGDGDLDQWSWPITVSSGGAVTSNAGTGSSTPASQASSSTANLNNAAAAGNTLWLSDIVHVGGVPATGATVTLTNQTVTIGSTVIAVPDAEIYYSPYATTATTVWDPLNNEWDTTVPVKLGGNIFAAGIGYVLPAAIAKNTSATWSATVGTDTAGVNVTWQWAAAAYTSFNSDPSQLGIKPCDDPKASSYQGGDKAGTPESYKSSVTTGGTGNGGNNFTGNLSPPTNVKF